MQWRSWAARSTASRRRARLGVRDSRGEPVRRSRARHPSPTSDVAPEVESHHRRASLPPPPRRSRGRRSKRVRPRPQTDATAAATRSVCGEVLVAGAHLLAEDLGRNLCRMSARRATRNYDHRLVRLVQETGDPTIATRLGLPCSTAAGWVRRAPQAVVTDAELDATHADLLHCPKRRGHFRRHGPRARGPGNCAPQRSCRRSIRATGVIQPETAA